MAGSGRGRKPKPTAIAKLQGNPGKRALNTREPKYSQLVNIEPPSFLDDEARAEWRRLSPALVAQKILTEADAAVFAAYCAAFSDFHRASIALAQYGDIVTNGEEGVRLSPYLKMKRDAEQAMVRWAREFGFSPSSRTSLIADNSDDDDSPEVAALKLKYGISKNPEFAAWQMNKPQRTKQ